VDTVSKFKPFILETNNKRNRALQKENDERKQSEKKQSAVVQLQDRLKNLSQRRNELRSQWGLLQPFRHFLNACTDRSDEFADPEEILTRHRILTDTHRDLQEACSRTNAELEQLQIRYQQRLKECQNTVLVSNSELARLQQQLETAASQNVQLEGEARVSEEKGHDVVWLS